MNLNEVQVAVRKWFEMRKWAPVFHSDQGYFEVGLLLKCSISKARLIVHPKAGGCVLLLIPSVFCRVERQQAMMRYLTLVNYGLLAGNFEMDLKDGEIRFKSFVECAGLRELPPAILDFALRRSCGAFQKFADGLSDLLRVDGDLTADEAFAKIMGKGI